MDGGVDWSATVNGIHLSKRAVGGVADAGAITNLNFKPGGFIVGEFCASTG
jgi:hypothetical protein